MNVSTKVRKLVGRESRLLSVLAGTPEGGSAPLQVPVVITVSSPVNSVRRQIERDFQGVDVLKVSPRRGRIEVTGSPKGIHDVIERFAERPSKAARPRLKPTPEGSAPGVQHNALG